MRLAFLSGMTPAKSPTERLWVETAAQLRREGCVVGASVPETSGGHGGWDELEKAEITVHRRWQRSGSLANRVLNRLRPDTHAFDVNGQAAPWLRKFAPDLVCINQGGNLDAEPFMTMCRGLKIPYTVLIHAVSPGHWPTENSFTPLRDGYLTAEKVWTPSRLSLSLTEMMIGAKLDRTGIFHNPLGIAMPAPSSWPEIEGGSECHFVCVGRLFAPAKGQDILLKVLSREIWRQRSWRLTLAGSGVHERGLKTLATSLGLAKRVEFPGFVDDIASLWKSAHLCVMPSRYEGLPIALLEALACARPAVVTRETGAEDIMTDGEHGFLAAGASEALFSEALEEAWSRRHQWRAMGALARERLLTSRPSNVAAWFAAQIQLLSQEAKISR